MSTINDVAKAAGVSVATVSRALRGLERVSPETRARVQQVATELSYVASPTAASLASGRTRTIAVVAPFLTRWYFSTLLSAIQQALRPRGYHVMLFDLEGSRFDHRLFLTPRMLWKRVDGVVTLDIPLTEEERALLDRLGLPVVSVGTPVPNRPSVRIDEAWAIRTVTGHLLDLGHREVGYVGSVAGDAALPWTPQQRLEAFRATMADHGLTVEPDLVLASDWTLQGALRDAMGLFGRPHRPTGVVAASDEMAVGVIEAARRRGLRVPEDVSVVGIDDYPLAEVFELTTIRQNAAAQGALAVRMLLGALVDGVDLKDEEVVVPTELVVRASTAPPAQVRRRSARGRAGRRSRR